VSSLTATRWRPERSPAAFGEHERDLSDERLIGTRYALRRAARDTAQLMLASRKLARASEGRRAWEKHGV